MVGGQAGPDTGHGHRADSRKCEVFPAGTITCLLPRAEMGTCHDCYDCHALSRCPGSCQAKNLREAGRSFSAARSSWLCWGACFVHVLALFSLEVVLPTTGLGDGDREDVLLHPILAEVMMVPCNCFIALYHKTIHTIFQTTKNIFQTVNFGCNKKCHNHNLNYKTHHVWL